MRKMNVISPLQCERFVSENFKEMQPWATPISYSPIKN
jgi:hypothetical protein